MSLTRADLAATVAGQPVTVAEVDAREAVLRSSPRPPYCRDPEPAKAGSCAAGSPNSW